MILNGYPNKKFNANMAYIPGTTWLLLQKHSQQGHSFPQKKLKFLGKNNFGIVFWKFPRALSSGTPSGGGLYLTVYPSSCPYTDTICCYIGFVHYFGHDNYSYP